MGTVLGPGFPRGPPEDPPERVGGSNPNYILYQNKEEGTIANFQKRVWGVFWGLDSPEDPLEDPPENPPEDPPEVPPEDPLGGPSGG